MPAWKAALWGSAGSGILLALTLLLLPHLIPGPAPLPAEDTTASSVPSLYQGLEFVGKQMIPAPAEETAGAPALLRVEQYRPYQYMYDQQGNLRDKHALEEDVYLRYWTDGG